MLGQACAFVRNVVLARLLSPEDFGIAATFALTATLLEMLSNLAADRLLVQAPDGDDERLEAAAHLLELGRGVLNGSLLFLLAPLVAAAFSAPQATWAFRVLAVVPLLQGLWHLDPRRFQRSLRFAPVAWVGASASLSGAVLAWPLATYLGDYSAVLWLIVIETLVGLAASRLVAERRYRVHAGPAELRRLIAFGWPLLVNSALMFGIFQGDRLVIATASQIFGERYSLDDLGQYSAAAALALAPGNVLVGVGSLLLLPALARVQGDSREFPARYALVSQGLALVAGAFALGFAFLGPWLVVTVLGPRFGPAADLVPWLTAMHALRVMRAASTQAAIAVADSRGPMYANLVRSASLVPMVGCAAVGGPLVWVAVAALAGEAAALLFAMLRLRHMHAVPLGLGLRPALLATALVAAGAVAGGAGGAQLDASMLFGCAGALAALVAAMLLAFAPLRAEARVALAHVARVRSG
jgi:O-antigen/teichoic acid export membrane protein